MEYSEHRCSKSGGDINVIKYGKTKDGRQRYKCKLCSKRFLKNYHYKAYLFSINSEIVNLLKEGVGIRGISRLLKVSSNTVLSRILKLSKEVTKPMITLGKCYEMDELCTYIRNKNNRIWIAYSIRKDTREVVDFKVGKRTNKTLRSVVNTLLLSEAKKIYTDKLKQYRSLIPSKIHKTTQYGTNHIERMNVNLRTHLKRLSRKTICYSKSLTMLNACLTLYFWG